MAQGSNRHLLADEIISMVQINRTAINGMEYGQLVLEVYEGRLVEIKTGSSLRFQMQTG